MTSKCIKRERGLPVVTRLFVFTRSDVTLLKLLINQGIELCESTGLQKGLGIFFKFISGLPKYKRNQSEEQWSFLYISRPKNGLVFYATITGGLLAGSRG